MDETLTTSGIPFGQFMRQALYGAGGYYETNVRIGQGGGDFYTAAQLSLFADVLQRYILRTWRAWSEPERLQIVELGAGQGELASRLCDWLSRLAHVEIKYVIIEPSAHLRAQQQDRLRAWTTGDADAANRLDVCWGSPDADMDTVLLANEVLDALPVERVRRNPRGWQQAFVRASKDGQHSLQWRAASADIEQLAQRWLPIPSRTEAEICPDLWPLFARCLGYGRRLRALFFDYGITLDEWRAGVRPKGTVRGYRQHQIVDPLEHPGRSDITADVHWACAMDAARAAGFDDVRLTPQGRFLIDEGILDALEVAQSAHVDADGAHDWLRHAALMGQFKRLVLPEGMGERFSVLECSKDE